MHDREVPRREPPIDLKRGEPQLAAAVCVSSDVSVEGGFGRRPQDRGALSALSTRSLERKP